MRTASLALDWCYGTAGGAYTFPVSISAICGEGNSTGLLAGVDDACYCPTGMSWSDSFQSCLRIIDRWQSPDPSSCAADPARGNPIYPLTGRKRQEENLGFTLGGMQASVVFDSLARLPYATGSGRVNGTPAYAPTAPPALPGSWSSNIHKGLHVTAERAQAFRGGGRWVSFQRSGSAFVAGANVNDLLVTRGSGWRYFDKSAGTVETYDATGRIVSAAYNDGRSLSYAYSTSSTPPSEAPAPGLLVGVVDELGRRVSLAYDSSARLSRVTTQQGTAVSLTFDGANNLGQLIWPDGAARTFLYEHPDLPWALTGIKNERNARHSSYAYSPNGMAIGTARHSRVGTSVAAYGVDYGSLAPMWTVTETLSWPILWRDHFFSPAPGPVLTLPNGAISTMTATSLFGSPRLKSQSQPEGSGCAASVSTQSYDANGNISSRDDFSGNRVCYGYDLTRNLETGRIEGLAAGISCGVTAAGSTLPGGSRKISTEWHPDWALRTRVAEPARMQSFVFNGRPDPFAGGALASCAPASAVLPDGEPIAVLCKQVDEATTDDSGALGFSAAIVATVAPRVQRWTYNEHGQVLTHDGPRTDVSDITLNEYYTDSVFTGADPYAAGHTRGDLKQTISPAGHVTRYTVYNKMGQLLEMIDPNGIVTSHTYDLRQRLTSTSVGGQTTTFAYWPNGLIQRITQPDGSWVHYEHDDAHRLIKVSDNLGNSVSYTLDNLGNRVAEDVRDPANVLRRQLTRSIDALGRVQLVTGRE